MYGGLYRPMRFRCNWRQPVILKVADWQTLQLVEAVLAQRRARINLVLPAGEIPAPIRGGAASPGIESWAREVTNRTKRRQSDARAVTKVKLLSLVQYLTAGRQYRSGWQAPVGTPQVARWPETAAGSESTARSEREAPRDLGDPLWS